MTDVHSQDDNRRVAPSGLAERWRTAVRHAGLFHPGDRVGVATSGGADSMLLLDFTLELSREIGLKVTAVHFNHCLRGRESDADERFVRERAGQLGIEFISARADTRRIAREHRKNLEATARELRYRFFFGLVRRGKLDKIVTAHTASDQAETVLLRLLRGAGTRGLGGIRPRLEGGVLRPFLGLTRAQVESEVARRKLAFRTDSTNADTRFARNRMRQAVVPLLERSFNPNIVTALAAFADRARDDEEFLESQARERSRPWIVRESGALKIPVGRLNEFPAAIARRVLRQMLGELLSGDGGATVDPLPDLRSRQSKPDHQQSAHGRPPTHVDIECIRRLASSGQSGRQVQLGNLEVRREFEWLVFSKISVSGREIGSGSGYAHQIQPPAQAFIPELNLLLDFKVVEKIGADLPQQSYTGGVCLDLGGLQSPLILRNFRPGDRVQCSGRLRPIKLKEIFQKRRIPRDQRPYWPVLESQGKIVWTRGLETSLTAQSGSGPVAKGLIIIEENPERASTRRNKQ